MALNGFELNKIKNKKPSIKKFWITNVHILYSLGWFLEITKNKKEKMMEILFTYANNETNEIKNQILKSSGLNPTVYEPKCLSLLNAIMLTQKIKDKDEFLLLVYGEEENYLIQRNKSKFIFTENKISKSDTTLLKQVEKLPDATGPFWDELYDRFLENIKPVIDEQLDSPGNKIEELNIFTTFENNKKSILKIVKLKILFNVNPPIRFYKVII